MPLTGKIKNLFEDKDMTVAVFPRTKVKAISDDNGVGLDAILDTVVYSEGYTGGIKTLPVNADTLGEIPASEYVDKSKIANNLTTEEEGYVADARALKTLNDKFNMDLLWENESYTSDFEAQPVNISNPSKYNMFVIRYKLCAADNYDYWGTDICVKGYRGWLSAVMGSGGQGGSYAFSAWRQLIIPNGGNITFFDCYKNNKTTNTPEVDNGWMIPYQIFGIKGGINT